MKLFATPPAAKGPSNPRSLAGDAILGAIQQALASTGLDTGNSLMRGVTQTIRQAFASAGLASNHPMAAEPDFIDVVARVVPDEAPGDSLEDQPEPPAIARPGSFVSRVHSSAHGTRSYKVFEPSGHEGTPLPMVVMLHGCTQNPDDFAAGTRMNELAQRLGFIVVYPAQPKNANGSNCWNWFKSKDQGRERGEPALIAGIARDVLGHWSVDQRRIFVAGLSAGAAMAVILGETYPELFAGVGAHSGVAYAAAHDMPSAFAAMQAGAMGGGLPGRAAKPKRSRAKVGSRLVPTIVFHGDRDATVNVANGAGIVADALAQPTLEASGAALLREERTGSAGGRDYTVCAWHTPAGTALVEHWTVHGAGHAWSGGSALGSFTDARGPDASAEMVRFFLAQPPVREV